MLLLTAVFCLLNSPGWRSISVAFVTGNLVWVWVLVLVLVGKFAGEQTVMGMATPLIAFSLALWVFPVLFYCIEKRVRHHFFLQWKMANVCLGLRMWRRN